MVRTIAGVFAGLMVVGVVVFGLQSVSTAMYPPPEGVDLLDPANQAVFDSYVQSLPLIGWLIAFGSEVLGGFLGATAAGFVAKSHARFAAAGWGGDNYAVAHNETTDQTILVIHWDWDTSADAEEFYAAFAGYNQARFGSPDEAYSTDAQTCWTGDQVSCTLTKDERTLWVLGPSAGIVSQVIQSLSGYGALTVYTTPTGVIMNYLSITGELFATNQLTNSRQ